MVTQDFADAAGRRNHRRDGCWQRRIFQPVGDLLADEVVVAAVFELQADKAEREHRVRADVGQPGRAGDSDLQRDGDVAFDLFRRLTRILSDDFNDRWRRVGIGFDIEDRERTVADADKSREGDQGERPPRQAERHQTSQHGMSASGGGAIDEQATFAHDVFTVVQTFDDLDDLPVGKAGLDVTTLDGFVLACDPDMRSFAIVDNHLRGIPGELSPSPVRMVTLANISGRNSLCELSIVARTIRRRVPVSSDVATKEIFAGNTRFG